MSAKLMVQAARARMILEEPFFGALALRLKIREDPSAPAAWTDGETLGYNPNYVSSLTQDQLVGLVAHEVMHCAMGHPWRLDGRDPRRANMAMDYAINPVLVDAGHKLPVGALLKAEYHGKSYEWIYPRMPKPPAGGKGGGGEGRGPAQPGEVRPAPTGASAEASEVEWQQAVQQAATIAKSMGHLPGSLDRFAKEATQPKADWRSLLRRFLQDTARDDYTMRHPNRRYVSQGIYLPSLRSTEVGPIVFVEDTSGSIDAVTEGQYHAEVRSVVEELRPREVRVVYADAAVQRVDTFERGDPLTFRSAGGGGTDFRPAFRYVDGLPEPPVCLVYLTDLMGTFPAVAPDYPVIWAATCDIDPPFGERVMLE